MTPEVRIQKTDGNLGVAANSDRILMIIGPSERGELNRPQALNSRADVVDAFGEGPLSVAAAYVLDTARLPVVCVRSAASTPGSYGAIDTSQVDGTSDVTAGASPPLNSFDVVVQIVEGGTVGTAGITYRVSLDNARSWSAVQQLGTAEAIVIGHGVRFELGAGTLATGDTWTCSTQAPESSAADLAAAYDSAFEYSGDWLRVLVLGEHDATKLAALAGFVTRFHAFGKYPEAICSTRRRAVGESRADYQAAMATLAGLVQSTELSVCADQCELLSPLHGIRLRVPTSVPVAARLISIDDSVDGAQVTLGALPGVAIADDNGQPVYHDEVLYPGLDAVGFTTLRSWRGRPRRGGAWINNPRLMSGPGSDYRYFQLTAIVNRAIEHAFSLLEPKLSQGVLVEDGGTIREDVAAAIEDAVNAELRSRYVAPGRVSDIKVTLSRTDNVLSTDTISFSLAVLPLAYVKKFLGKAGLVRAIGNSN